MYIYIKGSQKKGVECNGVIAVSFEAPLPDRPNVGHPPDFLLVLELLDMIVTFHAKYIPNFPGSVVVIQTSPLRTLTIG